MVESASPNSSIGRVAPRLATAVLVVAMGYLGSRLLGVARTVVIADEFGTAPELSAFWVAFRLPDLVFQALAGATLASAFVPVFARYIARHSEDDAWRLASSVLNLLAIATLAFALLAVLLAPLIVPLTAPGLGEETGDQERLHGLAVELTQLMLLSPVFFSVGAMLMAILNARQRFFLSALAPMLYNVGIIFGALVLSGPWGVHGLAIGVVLGSAMHFFIQLPGLALVGMRYRPTLNWRDEGVREVGRLMLPRTIGLAAAQLNLIITIFFASRLGDQTISALNYAWTLAVLPLGLFGMAISTAVFPTLAAQAASESIEALRNTIIRSLRVILFLTVPASVGLILLREPLVALLLERGAFTDSSTDLTSSALALYSVGLFALAAIEILSRGFYAIGDTRTPVTMAVLSMVLTLMFSLALVGPLEHDGLALAFSLAVIIEAYLLYINLDRRLGKFSTGEFAAFLFKVLVSVVLMTEVVALFVFGFAALDPLGDRTFWASLIVVTFGAAFGAVAYLLTTSLLRCDEARLIWQRFDLGNRLPSLRFKR